MPTCTKHRFWGQFYAKRIDLPRQARDEHGKIRFPEAGAHQLHGDVCDAEVVRACEVDAVAEGPGGLGAVADRAVPDHNVLVALDEDACGKRKHAPLFQPSLCFVLFCPEPVWVK
jgi:hypothetical protein